MPSGIWIKEIAISGSDMELRSDTGPAPQDELVTHKFSIILSDGSLWHRITNIRRIMAHGPLPEVTIELSNGRV